jgi:hypothetical protein
MALVVIKNKVNQKDIKKASEEYGSYIKIVVDVKTEDMIIGGEWHVDAEKELLKLGNLQENIWGGGIDTKTKKIDYSALINIRVRQENDSMEILNKDIKEKFTKIVKDKFQI